MKNKFNRQSLGFVLSCVFALVAFIADHLFLKSGMFLTLGALPIAGTFIYRNSGAGSEGGAPPDTETDELKAIKAIGEQVENFKTLLGDKANADEIATLKAELEQLTKTLEELTSAEVTKALKSINEKNESIYKQVLELQERSAEEKEKSTPSTRRAELVTTKMVEDFVKATFGADPATGKKTNDEARIEIKAAETFGYPTFFEGGEDTIIDAFTGRFVDPTLYMRRRKKNLILDYFDIPTINVPRLIYLEKVEIGDTNTVSGDAGGAAWILSGQAKPKRSFRVTSKEVVATKVAIFGTVEDKLLRDVPSLENWIREDFMMEIREAINDGLLNNNPAINPEAPLGLKTNAIQYSATPAYDQTIDDANYIDMIFALQALFRYNKEGDLGLVFVSSDVYTRIMHLKDTNDRYLNNNLVYVDRMGELYIGQAHIVWVDEEDVPSANVLAVGRDVGFKIKAYGPLVFERGLNGEDFRYDRTSFRAYQEFLSYIPSDRENSVLYDTWENIETAIAAVS